MYRIYFYDTDYGKLAILLNDGKLVRLWFGEKDISQIDNIEVVETNTHIKIYSQIMEYFTGRRKYFDDIELQPEGSDFQKRVWKELLNIPYGETRSYKYIAEKINNPKAYRAVGLANNKNPIPIIYPCHRVVGSSGRLTGYAYGLDMKKELLDMEDRNKA